MVTMIIVIKNYTNMAMMIVMKKLTNLGLLSKLVALPPSLSMLDGLGGTVPLLSRSLRSRFKDGILWSRPMEGLLRSKLERAAPLPSNPWRL